ncbi:heavy-metal-associated domain-containing protein [Lentilactobacillus farraginis]|uniref:Copper chaperone n=2 Tax=Lentilactobacillus farraginis DSM 18382 = JCM 14108 TaxID=1423743 RepID=X0PKY4_9LACO|nr:heavy-metal-associated domain-containing protein [Lentilactobacillus farraginis]GAF37376.1 copper chaperone [Lentilactobacillus farraginis DSM 18382 = JCM 14108]
MSKAILQLDALSCPSCMQKIQGALAKQAGVETVKVLFNAAKVKAEFDSDQISADKLAETVTDLGYDVKSVKVK